MFTGLIEATGRLDRIETAASGREMWVSTALGPELGAGDSIAVNGVCLTVTETAGERFRVDVAPETMAVTTLGDAAAGTIVNLERPLRADSRLGGHFVLGHVDGVGRIVKLDRDGDSFWLEVEVPEALRPYLIPKGSIAIDGISLTVARLADARVAVQIIPFTFARTGLQAASVGDTVNLEMDVLGKYVVRLLAEGHLPAGNLVPSGRDAS